MKGKVEQSWERGGAVPRHFRWTRYRKSKSIWSPSTTITNFTYLQCFRQYSFVFGVLYLSYLPPAPLGQDMTQGAVFLSGVFPYPRLVCLTKAEEPSGALLSTRSWRENYWIHTFPKGISAIWKCNQFSSSHRKWSSLKPAISSLLNLFVRFVCSVICSSFSSSLCQFCAIRLFWLLFCNRPQMFLW